MKKLIKLIRFIIAWFRIPKGRYCHSSEGSLSFICPYWKRIKDRSSQANGWCDYLGKGDLEIAAETSWTVMHFTKERGYYDPEEEVSGTDLPGSSLLWDKCKECGIRDERKVR